MSVQTAPLFSRPFADEDIDMAWAAGIFEGEGSIVTRSGKIALQVKNCDREVVQRFAEIVTTPDRVLGPYVNKPKDDYPRNDFYVWTSRVHEVLPLLNAFWPLLTETRKQRALSLGFTPESNG